MTEELKFVLEWVGNIVGKGENAGNLSPQCFQKTSYTELLKSQDCVVVKALDYILTLSQTKNFRLFQTERVCRRQF